MVPLNLPSVMTLATLLLLPYKISLKTSRKLKFIINSTIFFKPHRHFHNCTSYYTTIKRRASYQKAEPVPAPKSKILVGEKPGNLLLTYKHQKPTKVPEK